MARGGQTAWLRSLVFGLAAIGALAWAAGAHGNGAFPDGMSVILRPDRPREIIVVTNFGLIVSEDGGERWQYTCEDLERARNLWRYSLEAGPPFRIFAMGQGPDSFWGLAMTADDGCTWTTPAVGMDFLDLQDFFMDPTRAGRLLALAKLLEPGGLRYGLFASDDGGATFGPPLRLAPVGGSFESVEVARSDPRRLYLVARANSVELSLQVSEDRGATWATRSLPPAGAEEAYIVAVDPDEPDRLLVREIGPPRPQPSERLLFSADAGASWSVGIDLTTGTGGRLTSFLRRSDGTLLAAGQDGEGRGLGWGSSDHGRTWQRWDITGVHVRGLGERDGAIYAVTDQRLDGFALGRRAPAGGNATWEPLLRYDRIQGLRACARERCLGDCRRVAAMFALFPAEICDRGDRPVPATDGGVDRGGLMPSGGSTGCTCRNGPGRPHPTSAAAAALAMALLGLLGRHARRRSQS